MLDQNLNTDSRLVIGFSRFGKARPVTAGQIVKKLGPILKSNKISQRHKMQRCKNYIDVLLPKVIKTEIKIPDLSEELMMHIMEESDFARVEIMLIRDSKLHKYIIPLNARDSERTDVML